MKLTIFILILFLMLCVTGRAGEEYPFGTYAEDKDGLLQIDSCGFNLLRWTDFDSLLNDAQLDSFDTFGMDVIMTHQAPDPFLAPIYYYSWSRYMVWEADKPPEYDSLIGMDHCCGLIDEGAWMVHPDSVAQGETEIVVSGPRRYDTEGLAGILYQSIYRYKEVNEFQVLNYTAAFRIKGCDTLETTPIGKIRILRWFHKADSSQIKQDTLGVLDLYQDTDHSTYKEFKFKYDSEDLFQAGNTQVWVKIKYEIEYYGGVDTLWIDRIKVYEDWGDELINDHRRDDRIKQYASQYLPKPALIAWYSLDEPFWECFIPYRYIDSLLEENNIRKLASTKCVGDPVEVEKYIRQAKPKEFIMDYYPLGGNVPDSGAEFQGALDKLTEKLDKYRRRTNLDTLDFYLTAQGHMWCDSANYCGLRDPSPAEIRCMTNLGLAYGVDGVLYYRYGSVAWWDDIRECYFYRCKGLIDTNGTPFPKWYMVKDTIQPYIAKIGSTLLELDWKGACRSDTVGNPGFSFIDSLKSTEYTQSDTPYVEVGFFVDSAGVAPDTDYFMLVNRRCLEDESQNVTSYINKTGAYLIIDLYENDTTLAGRLNNTIPFTTHLDPGEGKLFKMVPR
jgi:hypothetical protein